MGFGDHIFQSVYRITDFKLGIVDVIELLYNLPLRLERFMSGVPGGNDIVIQQGEQIRHIQKLCSIRLLQHNWNAPMGVISEFVDI
jgi:hypothetical protein